MYDLHITAAAENDLNEAADYIEYVLLNPDAADRLLDAATEKISSLAEFAQRNAPVDDPVLKAWGIRFIQVNNYLAFYVISEEEKTVALVGIKAYAEYQIKEATRQKVGQYFDSKGEAYKSIMETVLTWTKGNNGYSFANDSFGVQLDGHASA